MNMQDQTTDAPEQETSDSTEKTTITTSVVDVQIDGFSDAFQGKIDTGAAQTSLHAEEIEVEGDVVTFVLNDRRYRTIVASKQDVSSSDGGTQSRPVIAVNMTIAGKQVPELMINLNDRSGMPQQLLIGQDAIKAADLVIDISEEPGDAAAGIPEDPNAKPEQEEVIQPEVTSSSIAQLGDNPLAASEPETQQGSEMTLVDIKAQLEQLLSAVEKLIQQSSAQ